MRRVLGACLVLGALVGACSPNDPPGGEGRLSIATGGSGGVYQVYGGGLADVLSDELPDAPTTAETTSASVDNLLLVAGRDSDIAFTLADTAIDAVEGSESFGQPQPLRALATLYPNITQVVVEADSGIETLEDMEGRTVSVGSPGSGTEVIALRLLEVAGVDPDEDITKRGLGVGESVQAMRDGSIDAFFWSGGVPTGAVTDLATTDDIRLLALEVEPFVAFMFIFYYAVLSEVSPPTALSAFAAAAITGGDGFRTMMLTARYTLPAFLVPFAFVLSPNGEGLLLQGDAETIVVATVVSVVAVAGLAVALGGWLRGPVAVPARVLAAAGSILLLYLEPLWIAIGVGVLALGLVLHLVLSPGGPDPAGTNDRP